jgi:hypothetical protein
MRLRSLSEEFSGFDKKSSAEPIIELNDKECDEKNEKVLSLQPDESPSNLDY